MNCSSVQHTLDAKRSWKTRLKVEPSRTRPRAMSTDAPYLRWILISWMLKCSVISKETKYFKMKWTENSHENLSLTPNSLQLLMSEIILKLQFFFNFFATQPITLSAASKEFHKFSSLHIYMISMSSYTTTGGNVNAYIQVWLRT